MMMMMNIIHINDNKVRQYRKLMLYNKEDIIIFRVDDGGNND
jgi:hypothetical protein